MPINVEAYTDFARPQQAAFDGLNQGIAFLGRGLEKRAEREQQERETAAILKAFDGSPMAGLGAPIAAAAPAGGGSPRLPSFASGSGPGSGYLATLIGKESGGVATAKNPNSTATGLGQFTTGTWNALAASRPDLGLTPNGRTDPDQSIRATKALAEENGKILAANDLPVNDGNLYVAHFLGGKGATRFLGGLGVDPNAPAVRYVDPAAAAANRTVFYERDGTPKSAAAVYRGLTAKFGSGRTAEADLPAPGAQAAGFDAMGSYSPDMEEAPGGFRVPPAPVRPGTGPLNLPLPPDAAPATGSALAALAPPGSTPAAAPTAPVGRPPSMVGASFPDLTALAGPAAPPPQASPREFDRQLTRARGVTADASGSTVPTTDAATPPLPPPRPAAAAPAPPFAPARIARAAGVNGSAEDAGVRDFTRQEAGFGDEPSTTGSTVPAPAPGSPSRPLEPTEILPPGVAGGPPRGPNSAVPVTSPATTGTVNDGQKALIRSLLANPGTRAMGMGLWQEAMKGNTDYGFQTVGDQLIRTNKRTGAAEVVPGITKPQPWQQFQTKDGRTIAWNPTDPGQTKVLDPGSGGWRPMTTAEKSSYGIPENTGASMGPDGQPHTLAGTASTNVKVDTAGQGEFVKKTSGALAERLDKISQEGDVGRNDIATLQQIDELGGLINYATLPGLRQRISEFTGVGIGKDIGVVQSMSALVDKMVPAQRIPGSGTTSDFDAKGFKASLPSLMKTPEGNQLVSSTLQALARDKIERATIAEKAITGEIEPKEAVKQLRALPSPNLVFRSGLQQLKEGGRLGAAAGEGGAGTAGAPGAPRQEQPQPRITLPQGVTPDQALSAARAEIDRGRDRAGVIDKLRRYGIDPGNL